MTAAARAPAAYARMSRGSATVPAKTGSRGAIPSKAMDQTARWTAISPGPGGPSWRRIRSFLSRRRAGGSQKGMQSRSFRWEWKKLGGSMEGRTRHRFAR